MIIESPVFERAAGRTTASAAFSWSRGEAVLRFEVTGAPLDAVDTSTADAFLVALLPLAMRLGETLRLKCSVSERLLFNIQHYAQKIISHSLPGLVPIAVSAESTIKGRSPGKDVATGFSCGVDSLNVVEERFFKEVPEGYRLTKLVFNDVGSHGSGDASGRLFDARLDWARGAAAELGLDLIVVRSNLPLLFPEEYVATNPLRNIAVALFLQGCLGRYYLASGYRYLDDIVMKSPDLAKADPLLAPLLSTERLEVIAEGGQFDRIEKIWNIADSAFARKWLNVCTSHRVGADNCSVCEKCVKTLFPLELVGKLQNFSAIFDLKAYERGRNRILIDMVSLKRPKYRTKLIQRAREKDFPMTGIMILGTLKLLLRKLRFK